MMSNAQTHPVGDLHTIVSEGGFHHGSTSVVIFNKQDVHDATRIALPLPSKSLFFMKGSTSLD